MTIEYKTLIITPENQEGILVDYTEEQIAEAKTFQQDRIDRRVAEETAKTQAINLKASAKAKLIAGEALTEDEANTIVL